MPGQKVWIAEVISHDVSWLTDKPGQRESIVMVRNPDEERSVDKHAVLRVLSIARVTPRWKDSRQLEVLLPKGAELVRETESRSNLFTVTVSR